ncbi:MAG: hypothetical protein M0Z99_20790 [Betaproteobacteria bacterium]|nr:hypothetical protein [Betaproteobacteria bacterium]
MSQNPYDALETLPDLDAGLFVRKLSRAMADTAMAVVSQDGRAKKGRVTITLDIERLNADGTQVNVTHTLAYSRPTKRGKATEEDTTATLMYVGGNGAMTLLPFKQNDLFGKAETAPSTASRTTQG